MINCNILLMKVEYIGLIAFNSLAAILLIFALVSYKETLKREKNDVKNKDTSKSIDACFNNKMQDSLSKMK